MATEADTLEPMTEAERLVVLTNRAAYHAAVLDDQADELRHQVEAQNHARAYADAGLSHLTPRARRVLEREVGHEVESDAMRAAAVECGFIEPPPPPRRMSWTEALTEAVHLVQRHELETQLDTGPELSDEEQFNLAMREAKSQRELDSLIRSRGQRFGLIADEVPMWDPKP
jgi:hypothetical protein